MNKESKILEPIAGAIFSAAFLILFNIFYYDILFITREFDNIRWFYNLSLISGFFFNVLRIFWQSKKFKVLADFVSLIFFVLIAIWLWNVFPFDTSVIGDTQTWDTIFKFLIIVPPILTTFATLVNSSKAFSESRS